MIRVCTPYYMGYKPAQPGIDSLIGDDRFEAVQRRGTYIAHARNSMITDNFSTLKKQPILDRDFLFVDSDIVFTKDHVEHIVELGKTNPIVFFPYRTHANPELYQCGEWGSVFGTIGMRYPAISQGQQRIGWCGAGFLFVKKEVLEEIDYPYFRDYVLDIGAHSVPVGEDIGFCIQVSNKGIPILCDFNKPVGHTLRTKEYLHVESTSKP